MTDPSHSLDETRLNDALWSLVAERGWHGVTLSELAGRAGTTLEALRDAVPNKFALLCRHARAVDRAVLADAGLNTGGTPRDRLFDTLMRRIDALQPHREGLVRFGRDLRRDPALSLALAPVLAGSMQWMLEAAQIESGGLSGMLRAKGLAAVWIATLRAWEQDDTQDLGPTMAALDRALDKAERAAHMLRLDGGEPAGDPIGASPGSSPGSSMGGPAAPAPDIVT